MRIGRQEPQLLVERFEPGGEGRWREGVYHDAVHRDAGLLADAVHELGGLPSRQLLGQRDRQQERAGRILQHFFHQQRVPSQRPGAQRRDHHSRHVEESHAVTGGGRIDHEEVVERPTRGLLHLLEVPELPQRDELPPARRGRHQLPEAAVAQHAANQRRDAELQPQVLGEGLEGVDLHHP